jgi:membrane fusion protein (multidrug efflux system)
MVKRFTLALAVLLALSAAPALAQFGPPGPPAVGVVKAHKQAITETNEFVGRIQAENRVDLVARVTAFIEQRLFVEGAEVQKGDLLYRLERAPFEADLEAKQASVAQAAATLQNATITLGRAQALLSTPAGQRSTYDDAVAAQRADAALLLAAQANLKTSQINLDYTEIHAPISGKIGETALSVGNVVTPSSGALATIVSQDPMYVVFPISVRTAIDLANRYADKGGLNAVLIRIRLPDGSLYGQTGKLEYVSPRISTSTDTITLRGTIGNPILPGMKSGDPGDRALTDGEFVNVDLEGVLPVEELGIPRAAVLEDQQGDYVYVVDGQNKVSLRRITLGQSTPTTAVVASGLQEGELVVTEGIQRVRPGITVAPGPATPAPGLAAKPVSGG